MPKKGSARIVLSIITTIVVYAIFQIVLFFVILIVNRIPLRNIILFSVVTLFVHAALLMFLFMSRESFYIEETKTKLDSVNIANRITLARISTLPTILFLIMMLREYRLLVWVLVIIVLAFLTDLLDGKISRSLHQVTRIGRILDSVSDYSLLTVISIVYFYFDLLPTWFFIIVLFRLFFQATGMAVFLVIEKRVRPETSFMGKVAIATTMILYAIELFRFIPVAGRITEIAVSVCEYAAGAVLVASVADKAYYFYRRAQGLLAEKKNPSA
jgi:cardiolipin synthase (CMP-forming)